MPQMLSIFIAILVVLALIGVTAWLVRRFAGRSIGGSSARGRMPRLAVIDATAVDGRRRLVLVRRDNVEHLLMIGGPSDLVVEPNIVRNPAQREQTPQRQPVGTELPPRPVPLPDAAWPDADLSSHVEPPELAEPVMPLERPGRASFSEDLRRPVSPPTVPERPRADDLGNIVPEPGLRPEPVLPRSERSRLTSSLRSEPRTEPMMPRAARPADPAPRIPTPATPSRPTIRPSEPAAASADQNLAEMAQRLEAALRRPGTTRVEATETRTAAVSVGPAERIGAPPVAPENHAPKPAAAETPAEPSFDNLEDEMASLLGRPKTPT